MRYPKSVGGPLMCWDLFMESHHRRLQRLEGLNGLRQFARENRWRIDWSLEKFLLDEDRVALVTDTAQVIRFATPNMPAMNGYELAEVMGQTPRIFQGEGTDPAVRAQLREALSRRVPFKGTLLNYRKNGTPYHCVVEEYPVWDKAGALVNFVAFEKIA